MKSAEGYLALNAISASKQRSNELRNRTFERFSANNSSLVVNEHLFDCGDVIKF